MVEAPSLIETVNLNAFYGSERALKDIDVQINAHQILGIIGPANSGKSTFLRTLNRLNYLQTGYRQTGKILFNGTDIQDIKDGTLRKKIGVISALPQVLPLSIFENIAYGPKVHGIRKRSRLSEIVEDSLKKSYLWDEVKDRLNNPAAKLSGGQQQRLCIARTLAVEPEIIMYDEPCSGLDPISTAKVEDAMRELNETYTQILVTNNTKQAARVSHRCAFFLMGKLVEVNTTSGLFTAPRQKETDEYIRGKFG